MPVVVIASPKGGSGKSTSAVLLGTELAHAGAQVTMLDCDPNHSLTLWGERGQLPPRITLLSDVSESSVVRTIQKYDADGGIVIVDLEGVASRLVSRAISQADLVLTPMRATTLDATIGVRTLALIAEEEEALGRPIRHAIVFTMNSGHRIQAAPRDRDIVNRAGGGCGAAAPDGARRLLRLVRVWRQSALHAHTGPHGGSH